MPHATVTVDFEKPIGTVSPRLYGHFAEHLGRCCYNGLWVGRDSDIPNEGGFRTDVLEAMRAMPTPLLRWPGGCFADHYHWRDGIGKVRPVRLGQSCGLRVEEDNGLGTHEFLDYCEAIGAEPYLAGNMGSGSVQEMCDWVEYTTYGGKTTLAKEREANGRKDPWNVKLWGVGNENWGCGGHYSPESYSLEYRRYSTMLRDVYPEIEMVFCGQEKDWNERAVETMKNHTQLLKHFSIHRYWIEGGPGAPFTEEQFDKTLAEAHRTEEFVVETREILDRIDPERKIGIALDEWGMWHADARTWGPDGTEGYCDDYTQAGTLRDALAAAVALEGFHRQCNVLSLCNLAQIVNVLHAPIMTRDAEFWLTPTYHVLRMHTPHIGGKALSVAVEDNSKVSATATQKDGKTTISIVNRSYRDANGVLLAGLSGTATAEILHAAPESQNSFTDPNRVAPKRLEVVQDEEGIRLPLPPHSFATVTIG
ncbi:alpha-N-arabinofuranosidase [bacterium]|nr:MAG: alpha-N-arabinofuranosidase [bacterium]